MKFYLAAIPLLAGAVSARFFGRLDVYIRDGACNSAMIQPVDDQIHGPMQCGISEYCVNNGEGNIASVHFKCSADGPNDSDIFVYPHDTLKFCRRGFCSCMTTIYSQEHEGIVSFDFNDDHAWSC
ncbi:hypothetical protein VHEMI01134 [[Torrubiella] hemipterigena]|uniref:Cyanovirin-N domain-containing protein n=1 Tax=[Torrubiella] hemipterigena TaxID=1531966 RepID=A0A0A1T6J9_9HYPO|nr:hypothetical protein VHEMI01134 [[Torrubiella] hemipterigena]